MEAVQVESKGSHGDDADRRTSRNDGRSSWGCTLLIVNTCLQCVSFYGLSTNLVNYFTVELHAGSQSAANSVTNWVGTSSITPLAAAFLADSFLGRYWTITIFLVISAAGYGVVTASALAAALQSAVFYAGLYLVALGGALQPVMVSFGADEFGDDESERGQQSSFFNWLYFSVNVGSLVGGTVLVWVQTAHGWRVGYGIQALIGVLAVALFIAGTSTYRRGGWRVGDTGEPPSRAHRPVQMTSQGQSQQHARDVPTVGGEGERWSRDGQGTGEKKKKKKNKGKEKRWSPVSRHHVVAAMLSRSRAVRSSPAAGRTSPAAMSQEGEKGEGEGEAVIETYSEPPTPTDDDMDQDDAQEDYDLEDNVEYDSEHSFEGGENGADDDEFATASASIRALTSKFRSEAWKEYVPLIVNGQVSSGRCKHCDKKISAKRGAGTSALLKHLDRCKKRDVGLRIVQGLNSTLRSPDGSRLKNWNFDPVIARMELSRMIALHGLPFILVEYEGFRRFVASLNPLFKPISRTTSRNDCMKAFKLQKATLQEIFKDANCRFSLTADMWTSNQTLGYMCITSHFITAEWKLTKKVIKFFVVETPHSGIAMFNQLLECIQEWNIEYKIFGITLDNASANDSMVFELRRNLVDKMALPVSGALLHNRCAAHVINLIVQDGLAIVHVKAIVNNIRESVKYIRSSEARKKKFKYVISKAGLPVGKWPTMDTPTRWNSTYLMIETAMEYRRAFDSLAKQDSNYTYAPSEKDWEKAAVLCKVLKVFYDATMVISGTTYPTSNLYFHEMWKVKHTLHNEATNADLGPMVAAMELKFNKYWYSSYLNLAIPVLLDPRFKLKYVEFRLKQAFVNDPQPRIDKVKRTFKNLFNEYFAQLNNGSNFSQPPGQDHSQMATPNDDDIFGDWDNHLNEQMQDQVTTELDRYLSERPISRSGDFDILNWWSTNSGTYPTLAAVARDVLAMPASTVASESVFSMGGRIVTDFRSRLGVESVEALVCSQDWYRGQGPSASHRRMGAITDVVDLNDVETESPLA